MEERKLNTRQPKPSEELNVIDDILFNEIMADEEKGEEVCRIIRVKKKTLFRKEADITEIL